MSRDRDRILEQALKRELIAAGTPPAGACLDAETLGAWTDGGLDPAAMVAAEAHVSHCARCQALIGTMGRSSSTGGTPATSGTWSWWKWWLAPIAAGVTAVTLWMVVPEQPQVAVAPPQAKANSTEPPPAAAAEATPPPAPAQTLARERIEARDNRTASTRADQAQLADAAAPKEEAAKLAEGVTGQRQETAPAAPAAPSAAAVALEAPVAGLQKSARNAVAPIDVFTLDRARRWRIVNNNLIERTDDNGATWRLMGGVDDQSISAGSAPSDSVAWFVGTAGTVLLTTDAGATLKIVNLAEPLDLASVSATDAQNAIVSTVGGRRFRTDDGGRTWRPF
jgi:cytoskeletal protein RodZ